MMRFWMNANNIHTLSEKKGSFFVSCLDMLEGDTANFGQLFSGQLPLAIKYTLFYITRE